MGRRHFVSDRYGLFLAIIFGLVVLFGYIDYRVHQTSPHETLSPPPNRFDIVHTNLVWHGQPVYRVTSQWHSVLKRITLESWSNHVVPILYVGNVPSADMATVRPDIHPPINLKPGESLWLAASTQEPYKLTVFWVENGHQRYQNYQIPRQSP